MQLSMVMFRLSTISILVLIIILIQGCAKNENDDFSFCTGCELSEWSGYYTGSGAYFSMSSGETTDGVEVSVNIENSFNDKLDIEVDAPGYIAESFSKSKEDDYHYLNTGGGARTLDLGLRKKGNEYKLEGTLKKNSWNKIDSVWVVDQSLTFQLLKN